VCLCVALVMVVSASCVPPPDGPVPETAAWPLWSMDVNSVDNPLPDRRLETSEGALDLLSRERFFLPWLPDEAATHEAEALFTGWATQLADLRGWGAFAPAFVRFSAPLDPASVEQAVTAGALRIVSLGDDARPIGVRAKWHAIPGMLEVEPLVPMRGGQRYALVIGPGLLTEDGGAVGAPDGFTGWLGTQGSLGADAAAAAGLREEELVLVVDWRVDDSTDDLERVAEQLLGAPPAFDLAPEDGRVRGVIEADAFAATFPDQAAAGALDFADRVIVGAVASAELRDGGPLAPAFIDDVTAAPRARIEVVIVHPRAADFPPPWRTLVVQHGFGGNNRFVMDNARELTAAGFALVGIDAASHGTRGNFVSFFNVEDPRIMRDNFRQTIVDLLQVAELVRLGDLDLDGTAGPDFDGSVGYFGHSMGSILGLTVVTLLPVAPVAVLHAGGGGIANILQSEIMQTRVELLILPALGLDYASPGYEPSLPFLSGMLQVLIDRSDPIAFSRRTLTDRPASASGVPTVLIQQGLGDRMVGNPTTEDLARALGVDYLEAPATLDGATSGVFSTDPLDFGVDAMVDPHDTYFHVPGVRAQAAAFLRSGGTELLAP
jgi:hypothetical protein